MNKNKTQLETNCNFVEHCWTLIGWHKAPLWYADLVQQTAGEPTTVDFDGQWVLDREEERGDVIGFLHTHPSGSPDPSARDIKTMQAWGSSFGKPLLCLIETDQQLVAYVFENDECAGQPLHLARRVGECDVVVIEE